MNRYLLCRCRSYGGGPHAAAVYMPLVQTEPAPGGVLTAANEALVASAEARVEVCRLTSLA